MENQPDSTMGVIKDSTLWWVYLITSLFGELLDQQFPNWKVILGYAGWILP